MSQHAPIIKFFSKGDGSKVAYAIHGNGPALIVPAWWVSHIDLDWDIDAYRQFFSRLGEFFTVVRYDRPGVGLSDRKRSLFTLEDEVDTLTELVEHLDFATFSLLGVSCAGPPSILYAQAHPERVEHIIFIDSYLNGEELGEPKVQGALCSLIAAHWGLGAKTILDLFDPDMDADTRSTISEIHRRSTTPEMAAALLNLSFSMNATQAANQVTMPTLIMHHSKDRTVPFSAGRKLAVMLPNSQFVSIEGKAHVPWMGDKITEILERIIDFTGNSSSPTNFPIEYNQFKKTGSIWALTFAGKTVHIKNSRGLNDIALLIQQKNKEVYAADLVTGEYSMAQESTVAVSDQAALQQYRGRLNELIEEKSLAAVNADEAQYAALETEEEQLINALKQSVGLGGRARTFDHNAEKARKAVAARVRVTLHKISTVAPELGAHLTTSIKTGKYCCYSPSPDISWLT
ncbi:alpha/beta hydrolase [Aliiglaciecola litoralis]|uniref:AB hydrolase-1 domain-containing protein n=1 Tax=Aliiglaciecola litoralis TaxID=582857 RepID=A0ABN1LQH0_9ALTE